MTIETSNDSRDGSYTSSKGLEEKYKHFSVKLTKKGFGLEIPKYDVLEALLHECFMHGYSLVKDYNNDQKINYEFISTKTKNMKYQNSNSDEKLGTDTYDHVEMTHKIFDLYQGKKFSDIPDNNTYIWPKKAFKVLKEYVNGSVLDFKLQAKIFKFRDSSITVNEQTGIIELSKDDYK